MLTVGKVRSGPTVGTELDEHMGTSAVADERYCETDK